MIICVANTSPERVGHQLSKKGFEFSMWKPKEKAKSDVVYGFFNFDNLREAKVKKTPIFFNLVSAFNHIEVNYPIYRYDYSEKVTGLVLFKDPDMAKVTKALENKFRSSELNDILFRPAKMGSYEGSELSRRWNNFAITLPFCVAETFMVCFITCIRKNDAASFHKFVVDNRLVGTGNRKAYEELDAIIRCMWPVMYHTSIKTEKAQSLTKKFLAKNPLLDTSLSRFLFWNRSYKGKNLSDYMDNENNVALGIRD